MSKNSRLLNNKKETLNKFLSSKFIENICNRKALFMTMTKNCDWHVHQKRYLFICIKHEGKALSRKFMII